MEDWIDLTLAEKRDSSVHNAGTFIEYGWVKDDFQSLVPTTANRIRLQSEHASQSRQVEIDARFMEGVRRSLQK